MIVRTLRLERGWSQEQLAQMTGLNIRTIQRIESGQKAGLESLKSLAAVFEVDLSDLNPQEPPMSNIPMDTAIGQSTSTEPAPTTNGNEPAYNARHARAKVLISGARFFLIIIMMFGINLLTSPEHIWAWWPALGLVIAFVFKCVDKLIIDPLKEEQQKNSK